jgi:hypothetical protein
MKTSHFEGRIALSAVTTAQRRDESTQRELTTFHNDFGGEWLVPPADCAGTGPPPGETGELATSGKHQTGPFGGGLNETRLETFNLKTTQLNR